MPLILAADIGGTTSRFAVFSATPDGALALLDDPLRLSTNDFSSFRDLLLAVRDSVLGQAFARADRVAFAVAGPVRGGLCDPPNIAWDLDLDRDLDGLGLGLGLGLRPAVLVNDFVAQAWGCLTEAGSGAEVIQAGQADPARPLAVVGAGTGLGHCALVPDGSGGHAALPSEAGHAAFAFEGQEEAEFVRFVRANTGVAAPVGDQVVSGSGLALVHWFLTSERLTPEEAAAHLDGDSPTLRWFARFYGRACRHYVLNVLGLGGLYVSGGVAARNPVLVRHRAFLREFTDSEAFGGLLAKVPVRLNANQDTGLYGAAFCAARVS